MKSRWKRKPCGCVKTQLHVTVEDVMTNRLRPVMIRCSRHRGKPSKRLLCYWDDDGIVRRDTADARSK